MAYQIARISMSNNRPDYECIFQKYLQENLPFVLVDQACVSEDNTPWPAISEWTVRGESGGPQINLDFLIDRFGDDEVPVIDCDEMESDLRCQNTVLKKYLLEGLRLDKHLYVKDYHFFRMHPNVPVFTCPEYFTSDWLNEYCDDNSLNDYKFVYLGNKGTWTPFHADVLRSFSWSANISGSKRWILYPPGVEDMMVDRLGNLPFDVNREPYNSSDHPSYVYRVEVIQKSNEIIFVPSGWHHQVHNLEETLSINHNWFNGCNIQKCWRFLQTSLVKVENALDDLRMEDNFQRLCQQLLRDDQGFNYEDMFNILRHIADKRLKTTQLSPAGNNSGPSRHTHYDLQQVKLVLESMQSDSRAKDIETLQPDILLKHIEKYLLT